MKKISVLIVLILTVFSLQAQSISGRVTNAENQALPSATVKLNDGFYAQSTNKYGEFHFKKLSSGSYDITVSYMGYETQTKNIKLSENENKTIRFEMTPATFAAEEITVWGTRAKRTDPVTFTTIGKEEIDNYDPVKDIPYLLEMTPALVSNSDAGAGVGYTTMRIRGSDISRINVTLDGIPLNDSESQGVWWIDLPDYAASAENIQVQRGVGSSTNGAGAFGANINFKTERPNRKPHAEMNASYGSFNTYKANVKASTGIIKDHFSFNTRVSKIYSDGYIDRAYSDLESVHISGLYFDKNNSVRLNFMHGIEETYQAWGGVPKDSLGTNRTFNPYTYENEIDFYTQTHAHLFYTRRLTDKFFIKTALHYTKGAGYYEQFKEGADFADYGLQPVTIGDSSIESADLVRRKWLDNDFYGIVFNANYVHKNFDLTAGGAANWYVGDHFGRVIKSEHAGISQLPHLWYENIGDKQDRNIYTKINYRINDYFNVMADLQYRNIEYLMSGTDDDLRDISQENIYHFFNPKAGINYAPDEENRLYFSVSRAQREPSRTDLKDALNEQHPQSEKLLDYELGYGYAGPLFKTEINLYYMDYKDQLVLTGQINNVGSPISVNVPESYRTGIEISVGAKFLNFLKWEANAALSKNKIKNYTAYIDDWDNWGEQNTEFYDETDISFSPEVIVKNRISAELFKGFTLSADTRYVSRQYIDNTASIERSIDPYLVNDLRMNYRFSTKGPESIHLFFSVNNLLNEEYETNAWVYRYVSGEEKTAMYGYFPQAGRHYMSGISIRF